MKVNDIWVNSGEVDEVDGLRYSGELKNGNYPRNKKLDMSCAYGLSRGMYSPVCNVSAVVFDKSKIFEIDDIIEHEDVIKTYKRDIYNYLLLFENESVNADPTFYSNHRYDSIDPYSNWGFNVSDEAVYTPTRVITGFPYNKTCGIISTITAWSRDFTSMRGATDFRDYIVNYSSEYPYISTIGFTIFCGCNKKRVYLGSEYEHNHKQYDFERGILVSESQYQKSLTYDIGNITLLGRCINTWDTKMSCSTETTLEYLIANKHLLKRYCANNTKEHILAGYNPEIIYYYDFEEMGVEPIYKIASTLGLVWAVGVADVEGQTMFSGDDNYYYPVLKDGFYQGDYVRADVAQELPQATWGDDYDEWYVNNGVEEQPDTNNYVDDIKLNKPTLSTLNTFNRTFIINQSSVNELSAFLWHSDKTKFETIVEGLKLMGQNPMNGIIDLRLYPFDVSTIVTDVTSKQIIVGRTNTEVNALAVTGGCDCVIELGSVTVRGYHNNFLDYEPYTQALLYIPYVGTVNIDVATFINKTLSVKLIVDLTTGQGTAVVFCNGIPYMYLNANVGVNIALSGDNASAYAQGVISAGASTLSSATTTALGVASGNIGVAVGGAVGGLGSAYSAFAQPVNMQRTGNNTPSCNNYAPQHCYLFIASPIVNKPDNYGHTIGYACEKAVTIGSVCGFSVFTNIDTTGLVCGDTERTEIINLLNSGVYL